MKTPSSLTYASVVSRDSVCIALTIVALNDLDILACHIQNAYLTTNCHEKIYTAAGNKFVNMKGKNINHYKSIIWTEKIRCII